MKRLKFKPPSTGGLLSWLPLIIITAIIIVIAKSNILKNLAKSLGSIFPSFAAGVTEGLDDLTVTSDKANVNTTFEQSKNSAASKGIKPDSISFQYANECFDNIDSWNPFGVSKDSQINVEKVVQNKCGDLKSIAKLILAYGVRKTTNRGIPFLSMIFDDRGTLTDHFRKYCTNKTLGRDTVLLNLERATKLYLS